eukprot:1837055-Prorocentrum_lima.AAC.1
MKEKPGDRSGKGQATRLLEKALQVYEGEIRSGASEGSMVGYDSIKESAFGWQHRKQRRF